MITRFHYEDLQRNKKAERLAFGLLTGMSPETYRIKTQRFTLASAQFAGDVAKELTIDAAVAGATWIARRSTRASVQVGARLVPYVGWALFAYDVYTIYDKFA